MRRIEVCKMRQGLFLVLTIWMFSSTLLSAQFPGDDVQLLLGKELKVKSKSKGLQEYGYEGFYKDYELEHKYAPIDTYYSSSNSKYKSLVGKVFKVLSYKPYTDSIRERYYKLEIKNPETGIIYFDYDPKYSFRFPFEVVGGLDLPEDFYCKKIEVEKDKFTGDIRYTTPSVHGFHFIKVISGNITRIYMFIRETDYTCSVGKKGVYLLFDNGSKLSKDDVEIDVEVGDSSDKYLYTAFFPLTESDIKVLSEKLITDDRLYIYDGTVSTDRAKEIRGYLRCLIK